MSGLGLAIRPEVAAPRRFARGMALPFRAAAFIARHPSTWAMVLAPVLLTAVGLTAGLVLGWLGSRELMEHLLREPASPVLAFFWQLARVAIYAVIVLLAMLLPPLLAAAPINDRLSAQVEELELGVTSTDAGLARFARELATSLVNAASRLLRFGVVQALLFLLNFIPVVQALYPWLAFLWSALWLGEQSLDQTTARHLMGWRDTSRLLARVRGAGFGMGLVLAALFLLPLANLFLVPVATVAGALLYCDLQRAGLLAGAPTRPSGAA